MSEQKKLSLLEDAFEMDEGELAANMVLDEIEEYNSMAKLALIVLMSDEFDKTLTSDQIKSFVTVKDILDYMG